MAKFNDITQPLRVLDTARKYRERAVIDLGLLAGLVWTAEVGHLLHQDLVIALSIGAGLIAYLALVHNRLKFQHEQRINVESVVSDVVMSMRQHLSVDKAPLIRDGLKLLSEGARYSGIDSTSVLIALSHLSDHREIQEMQQGRALLIARRVNSDIIEKYHDPQTMVQFASDVSAALSRQAKRYAKGFVKELQQRNICVEAWGAQAFDSEVTAPRYSSEAVDESMNKVLYWEDRHKTVSR